MTTPQSAATSPPAGATPAAAPAQLATFIAPELFAATLAAAEGAALFAKFTLGLPALVWLLLHLAAIVAATALLWRARSGLGDVSLYALALVATFVAGPAGAVLAVFALLATAREKPHPERLSAWYERISLAGDIDGPTTLYNTVAMGRALQTSTTPPPMLEQVMTQGSLEDRQTALGLIARQFNPSYAPALRLALVSPEPVIRVQAAAVAVKVRAELKSSFAKALERADPTGLAPPDCATLAASLDAMVKSGLLEDEDIALGQRAIRTLLGSAAAALEAGTVWRNSASAEPAAQALLETELLRLGRFSAFRKLRIAEAPAAKSPPGVRDV